MSDQKRCFTRYWYPNGGDTRLLLKWHGTVQKYKESRIAMKPDILYDQGWRCFIPVGSNKSLLTIEGIDVDMRILSKTNDVPVGRIQQLIYGHQQIFRKVVRDKIIAIRRARGTAKRFLSIE
jgi:hypothetical protein